MESPELSAKPLSVQLHTGYAEERQFTLTADAEQQVNYGCSIYSSSNPDSITSNRCKKRDAIYRAGLAVAPGLELGYTRHANHRVSAKYQFAGQHRETASTGNWSQALVVGYQWQQEDFDGAVNFWTDFPDRNQRATRSEWQQKTTGYDIGYVVGYRINPSLLIYGGPYIYKGDLKGEQMLTVQQNSENSQLNFDLNSAGRQTGANIALQFNFGQYFLLQSELVYSQLRWEDARKNATQLNLMFGVQF
ncbi:hypothetical protein SAMN04488051_11049 [Alkalimonas amylolytica]|uniref:Outer membrane protein beta-barrel domain-containing protein n=2 Tax=Alkalimonas amylolytica TaxID=152573 RepID=A0A1H4FFF2_ALKAM|nr:hypothetical protein SAMN04488051_11049 [Alkalimonas amylolytica]